MIKKGELVEMDDAEMDLVHFCIFSNLVIFGD